MMNLRIDAELRHPANTGGMINGVGLTIVGSIELFLRKRGYEKMQPVELNRS